DPDRHGARRRCGAGDPVRRFDDSRKHRDLDDRRGAAHRTGLDLGRDDRLARRRGDGFIADRADRLDRDPREPVAGQRDRRLALGQRRRCERLLFGRDQRQRSAAEFPDDRRNVAGRLSIQWRVLFWHISSRRHYPWDDLRLSQSADLRDKRPGLVARGAGRSGPVCVSKRPPDEMPAADWGSAAGWPDRERAVLSGHLSGDEHPRVVLTRPPCTFCRDRSLAASGDSSNPLKSQNAVRRWRVMPGWYVTCTASRRRRSRHVYLSPQRSAPWL